jgi:hypothetical protein
MLKQILFCSLLISASLYASENEFIFDSDSDEDNEFIFDSDSDEDNEFVVEMKTLSHQLLLTKISEQHAHQFDVIEKIEKKYENLKFEQEQLKKNELNTFKKEMCEDILEQLSETKKTLLEKNEEMIKEITDLLVKAKTNVKEKP